MAKKSHKPAIFITIFLILVVAIGGFYLVFFGNKNDSSSTTDDDLTSIIQNQNTSKFLKMFDKDSTKSSISSIGAKSILQDWNQNSTEDINQIATTLKKNKSVSGVENNYRIEYVQSTKLLFIKQSKLETMTSKLIVPAKLKKASIKVDGKNVKYSELIANNLFPGVYNFKIKLGKAESIQKVTVLGDGRSVNLTVPKQQEAVPTNNVEKPATKETKNNDADTTENSSSTNNDPKYKDAMNLTSSDLVGTWTSVGGENDPVGALPESITFTATTISAQRAHNIQNNMNIGSAKYSENDGLMVFYSDSDVDMPDGFAVKLVKRDYNGENRVMLEQDDQGMTGWYIRQ